MLRAGVPSLARERHTHSVSRSERSIYTRPVPIRSPHIAINQRNELYGQLVHWITREGDIRNEDYVNHVSTACVLPATLLLLFDLSHIRAISLVDLLSFCVAVIQDRMKPVAH